MWPEYAGTSKNLQILWNRPFHGIFNFWHGQVRENPSTPLKKCLEINKTAKFEIDLLKVNEQTASQSLKNLQTFVWGGGGHKLTPRHTNICKFSELCGAIPLLAKDVITFKFGNNFTNIEVLFSVVSTGFLWLAYIKSWKNHEKVYCQKKSQLKSSHKQILMLWNVTASLLKRFCVILPRYLQLYPHILERGILH